jgi:glycosyltransferase involved in cell wall biosynthesis
LSIRAHFKVGFQSVQACNPPDLIFIVAAFWKYLFGKPFIFDHHDINPELYEAKFGKRGVFWQLLNWFERLTFRMAGVSLATNETFKTIAVERGGMAPEDVYVVRSIPDVRKFRRVEPVPAVRNGRRHVIGYVGIMGAQDGVDVFIDAMADLVNSKGRRDVQAVIVGSGTEADALRARAQAAGLDDYVTFTGFLSGDDLLAAFSTFDVGVIPDPKNSYNDKISMNKHFEYMTLGIPFVQFDLTEGRRIADNCSLYARENSPVDLALQLGRLVDDEALRSTLARKGVARARTLLDWDRESGQLIAAYEKVLGRKAPAEPLEPVLVDVAAAA